VLRAVRLATLESLIDLRTSKKPLLRRGHLVGSGKYCSTAIAVDCKRNRLQPAVPQVTAAWLRP